MTNNLNGGSPRFRASSGPIGEIDAGMPHAVDVSQIAAEFDPLAAHPEASTAQQRQPTGAGNEVAGPLADRAQITTASRCERDIQQSSFVVPGGSQA
jgi:hypothetical protein